MFKGILYHVTCDELGLVPSLHTELGSYQAANTWWKAKMDAMFSQRQQEAERTVERIERHATLDAMMATLRHVEANPEMEKIMLPTIQRQFATTTKPAKKISDNRTIGACLDAYYQFAYPSAEPSSIKNLTIFIAKFKSMMNVEAVRPATHHLWKLFYGE
jgi:hypothetical protein